MAEYSAYRIEVIYSPEIFETWPLVNLTDDTELLKFFRIILCYHLAYANNSGML